MTIKIPISLEPNKNYFLGVYEPPKYMSFDRCHIYKINSTNNIEKVIMAAKERDIYLRFLLLDRWCISLDGWCIRKLGEYPLRYATQKGLVLNAKHPYAIWEEEL